MVDEMSEIHKPIEPNRELTNRAIILTDNNGRILQVDDDSNCTVRLWAR